MFKITVRFEASLLEQLKQSAKEHNESLSAALRRLIKSGLAITAENAMQKQVEEEHRENLELKILETAALLRLIRKGFEKLNPEDATRILNNLHEKLVFSLTK